MARWWHGQRVAVRLVVLPAVELRDGLVGELHVGHFLLEPFPLVPVPDRVVGSQLGAQADLVFHSSGVDRDMPQFEASWVLRHVLDFLVGPPHCDRRLIQVLRDLEVRFQDELIVGGGRLPVYLGGAKLRSPAPSCLRPRILMMVSAALWRKSGLSWSHSMEMRTPSSWAK